VIIINNGLIASRSMWLFTVGINDASAAPGLPNYRRLLQTNISSPADQF